MSISVMKQALDVLRGMHPEHGGNAFTRAADELRRAIDLQEKRHICPDWDFMEITVNDEEFNACCCFPKEPRPSLWLATAHDGRVKYTTDSGRASDWKESGSYRMVQDYYTEPPHDFGNVTDDALIEEVRSRGFTIRDAQISPKIKDEYELCCQKYDTRTEPCTPRGRHLAKREWVGLTEDDLASCKSNEFVVFAKTIEAKLKEKNNGN